MKTFLNSSFEELKANESRPKKGQKKNSTNEGDEEPEKPPSKKKPKKRNPGLISFFTTYHKTMWIAKYNCTFVYEDDDDDIDICEHVHSICKYE